MFFFEILLAISFDKEDKPKNMLLILLMYFTYCQLWIFVMLRAFYMENIKRAKHTWDKTERFDVKPQKAS